MLSLLFRSKASYTNLLSSQLYDDRTFYPAFIRDLGRCKNEVILESPFITSRRINTLLPFIKKLCDKDVAIIINTRDPDEHDLLLLRQQAEIAIEQLQAAGAQVLFTNNHHRKLAIIDRLILWEGSLNILSQNNSCEIMRRTESPVLAQQMLHFIKLGKFLR